MTGERGGFSVVRRKRVGGWVVVAWIVEGGGGVG